MARLPAELCDRLIDFVHDDPATLRATSLVSHDWLPASRTHLFSAVTVYQDPDDVPKDGGDPSAIVFTTLLRMLADNGPALRPYFASIRLHRCHNALATRILACLAPSRATSLHINALPDVFSESPVDFNLAPDFPSLSSLALHHVLFETLDELVAQVNPLRRLEHLELRHIYIKIPHSGLARTWNPPRHTGAVDIRPRFARCDARLALSDYSPESSIASLWPWLNNSAPQLRVVALEANAPKPEGKRILPLLLALHAPHLTSLSLRLRNCGEEDVVPPALALCTQLASLALQVSVACVRDPALPPSAGAGAGDFVRAAAQRMPFLPGAMRAFRLALLDVRAPTPYAWDALDGLPWHPDCACAVDLAFDTVGVPPASATTKLAAERLLWRSLHRIAARGQLQVSVE